MIDFLGIGAQKAATSWLYEHLRRHPHLGFPAGKEVHFWDELERGVTGNTIGAYAARFPAGTDPDIRQGEITPAYATLLPQTLGRIRELNPRLRLLMVLRNPIDRAWSHALMAMARARLEFDEASDAFFLDLVHSRWSRQRGDYERAIRNWRQVFGTEALLIERFESVREAPAAMLRRCASHIGVDPGFYRDDDPALVKRVFANPDFPIRPVVAEALQHAYGPAIRSLGEYLDTDLSEWLQR